MNKNVKYLCSISLKVLIGLAIFLSVGLLAWSARSIFAESQTELFASNSNIKSISKIADLPEPGSYTLHKIFKVPKLSVLDTKGQLQPISKYTKDKITLLTFFYDRCSDANGCPYAMALFHKVKHKLEKNEQMRNSVRLVHISFDPARDTPMMMAGLEKRSVGKREGRNEVEWNFLTTASVDDLLPVVDGFGQNVDININPTIGDKTLTYSHVLKAFLIDDVGNVREIYSTSYISAEMLLNDIQTLDLE
jgi:cytochrome oxidase Cu insertion factor (SCO1/SenC/PrrC family)